MNSIIPAPSNDTSFPAELLIPYDSLNELVTYNWDGALSLLVMIMTFSRFSFIFDSLSR